MTQQSTRVGSHIIRQQSRAGLFPVHSLIAQVLKKLPSDEVVMVVTRGFGRSARQSPNQLTRLEFYFLNLSLNNLEFSFDFKYEFNFKFASNLQP